MIKDNCDYLKFNKNIASRVAKRLSCEILSGLKSWNSAYVKIVCKKLFVKIKENCYLFINFKDL